MTASFPRASVTLVILAINVLSLLCLLCFLWNKLFALLCLSPQRILGCPIYNELHHNARKWETYGQFTEKLTLNFNFYDYIIIYKYYLLADTKGYSIRVAYTLINEIWLRLYLKERKTTIAWLLEKTVFDDIKCKHYSWLMIVLEFAIDHFTVVWNVTKPLYESEVRGDHEMIEIRN